MKRLSLYVLTVLSFFVLAGASARPGVSLFDEYTSYLSIIKTTQTPFVENMLSMEVREKIKTLGANEFPVLSSFPSALVTRDSYYQVIKSNKGCLTVNGFDSHARPLSLYIEYSKQEEQWLLSYIELAYLDTPKEFKDIGVCPSKF